MRLTSRRYLAFMVGCVILMLILPPPYSSFALGTLTIVSAWIGYRDLPDHRRRIPSFLNGQRYDLEIVLLILAVIAFTPTLRNFSSQMRIAGDEFSYLINSGAIAGEVFERTGSIPLWNPFMGWGEPLLENPFSFVLNPFMTLPIFAFGAVQGSKIAVLLHIIMMAVGGWLLGYGLKLKAPGRVLLGLLLGGSGSMAGAIGMGFYQMSLSQAYMPWIYAGLIGTLTTEKRWPVGVFVLAGTLMIFAGTFWYVLPVAIVCGLLVVFAWVGDATRRVWMIRRVGWALLLLLGLAAIRLLPQFMQMAHVIHPEAILEERVSAFWTMFDLYFRVNLPADLDSPNQFYHYILPPMTGVILLGLWLGTRTWVAADSDLPDRQSRWRILMPALLAIGLLTVWSQGGTEALQWLYSRIPLVEEWRFVGRVLAASALWIAVLAALAFDDIILTFQQTPLPDVFRRGAIAGLLLLGAFTSGHVLQNWSRQVEMRPLSAFTESPLAYLRSQNPDGFLSVLTYNSFRDYLPFYDTLTRAAFGNPDYRPGPIAHSLGPADAQWFLTNYAIPTANPQKATLREIGYRSDEGVVPQRYQDWLWYNADPPPYAFMAHEQAIDGWMPPALSQNVQAVTYYHRIDEIEVHIDQSQPAHVVVVSETAYPGWQVEVNGERRQVVSVAGMLGVSLYDTEPATIIFRYRPYWLYIGAMLSLLGTIGFLGYLLRWDQIKLRLRAPDLRLWLKPLYVAGFVVATVLMFIIPPAYARLLFGGLVLFSIRLALTAPMHQAIQWNVRVWPAWYRYGLELFFIAVCLLFFASPLRDFSPDMRIRGHEITYLINSGQFASEVFRRTGAIPLWNPLMRLGEPLIENPFSFVLNPLMTLPITIFGSVQGPKVGVLVHLVLLGTGGWMFGYVLGLGMPARLLMGMLIGGSGSIAGAVGTGFYQMGLSQTYMPWVYAGIYGTLHKRDARWPVVMLVVFTMLMIFAGTYWYVLPTAIAGGLMVLFALLFNRDRAVRRGMLQRILWAGLLIIGVGAVRLLPQFAHREFVQHPDANLLNEAADLLTVIRRYFETGRFSAIFYHYVLPPTFLLILVGLRILFYRQRPTASGRWRLVIPAIIVIVLFTLWAQEGPLLRWIYDEIPFLAEWRFPGRMMGAAIPWIVLLVGLASDDVIYTLMQRANVNLARGLVAGFMVGVGLLAGVDVMVNWRSVTGLEHVSPVNRPVLNYLRDENPGEFITVQNATFGDYTPFFATFIRARYGNPDYWPGSIPYDFGDHRTLKDVLPEYAIGYEQTTVDWLLESGFTQLAYEHPDPDLSAVLFAKSAAPGYVFTATMNELTGLTGPLPEAIANPVTTFDHQIDSIHVSVNRPGEILVVQETAYPGWEVTVNGEAAEVLSMGGVLAVALPDTPQVVQVVFRYVPRLLFIGSAITLLSIAITILYTVGLKPRLPRLRRAKQAVIPAEMLADTQPMKPIKSRLGISRAQLITAAGYAIEIGLILACIYYFTPLLHDFAPFKRIRGLEVSYLINSGAIASRIYDITGSIPLWNPFIGTGEPLLENPFSFVLNPFMTLPIFWQGTVQGLKLAVLLHIALMGSGGWMLGYTLRLKMPGRLLLALLMAGNGSMVGAIGTGFIQMGTSQAYVPWVYAGLFGTLVRRDERWPVGMLAVATALLIFSGTFWYVLPTAIGCAVIVLFMFLPIGDRSYHVGWRVGLPRLIGAGVLVVGLSAIRLLPQLIHHNFVDHELLYSEDSAVSIVELIRYYFKPGEPSAMFYHYVLPPLFVVLLFGLRVLLVRRIPAARWRILVPAFLLVVGFTLWAQGGPIVYSIAERFPVLLEWRFLERMLAAATPWLIVMAAISADEIIDGFERSQRRTDVIVLLTLVMMLAAFSVLENWNRAAGTELTSSDTEPAVRFLRERNQGTFVGGYTWADFSDYQPFYDNLVRTSFGNPDYQPRALPTTLGHENTMDFLPEYVVLSFMEAEAPGALMFQGYRPLLPAPGEPPPVYSVWYGDHVPTHVFSVSQETLNNQYEPLRRESTQPIGDFDHRIDSIHISLNEFQVDDVVVAQETAYPGWQVRVNGQRQRLESVDGYVGVVIDDTVDLSEPVEVIFIYRPVWVYIGGAITVLTAAFLTLYMLRIDRLIVRLLQRN